MGAPRLLPPLSALPGCRARERRGREFPFLGRPSGTGAVPRSVREGGNRKAAEKASLLSPCPVIPTEQFFRCVWGSRPPSRLSLFPRAAPSPQRGSPPLLAQTLLRAGLGQRPAGGGRAGTAPAPTAPPELLCWLGNPAQRRPRAPDGAAGRVAALQGQQPAATGAPRAAPAPAQALPPRPGQSLVFLCWEVRRNPPRAGRGAPGSRGWDPARDGTGGVFPWEVEEINMPLPGHLLRGSIARPGGPWLQRLLARRSRRSSAALGGLGRDCGPYVNGKGSPRPGLLPAGKEQTGKGSKRERAEESKKERKEEEK